MLSGYTIYLPEGTGRVATKGSFWVDPDSFDVLRLDVQADEIPPSLPLLDLVSSIRYSRAKISGRDVMLPESADVNLKTADGEMAHNKMQFTHCRSFQTESTVSFGAPATAATGLPGASVATGLPPPPEVDLTMPAGLTIPIGLSAA